ncbi:MAG: 5'/3'-nucleotidase SurE [Leptonema sp. (in: Bacteria)]|nr:5'/3'-nucleotidase SurE [Leptonema sp. (in: bacteria)]
MTQRILIVNDDGLHSSGMLHLEAALSESYEVWSVCPDRERSATSQAITIRETLRLTHAGGRHYHLNGYPADCVNVALHSGFFPTFDVVVSGINHGVNLGDDVHYSGTVGAARHAAVHHIAAIAISCVNRDQSGNFYRPAAWLKEWLKENLDHLKQEMVYNINYPYEPEATTVDTPFPRVEITRHGRRIYMDTYETLERSRVTVAAQESDKSTMIDSLPLDGRSVVLRLKETIMGREIVEGTDFYTVEHGRISITPLSLATFDNNEIEFLKNLSAPI